MAKVIADMPYGAYVLDAKDAVVLAELLSKAEKYQQKWKDSTTTHHIYPVDADTSAFSFRLITNDAYQMYKLAGKPED